MHIDLIGLDSCSISDAIRLMFGPRMGRGSMGSIDSSQFL